MRNNKETQTDRYTATRQLLSTQAIPNARQKIQDYFERYSEFYLKIVVYVCHNFSRKPSIYSAYLWLLGTATCA